MPCIPFLNSTTPSPKDRITLGKRLPNSNKKMKAMISRCQTLKVPMENYAQKSRARDCGSIRNAATSLQLESVQIGTPGRSGGTRTNLPYSTGTQVRVKLGYDELEACKVAASVTVRTIRRPITRPFLSSLGSRRRRCSASCLIEGQVTVIDFQAER